MFESWNWCHRAGRQWEYFADLRGQDAKSEWTDWRGEALLALIARSWDFETKIIRATTGRGEGQWNDWRPMERAAPAEPSRLYTCSFALFIEFLYS